MTTVEEAFKPRMAQALMQMRVQLYGAAQLLKDDQLAEFKVLIGELHQVLKIAPPPPPAPEPVRPLDLMIGRLDRLLSEFLVECGRSTIDEADRQTLKHHADDLRGVGGAALITLYPSRRVREDATEADRLRTVMDEVADDLDHAPSHQLEGVATAAIQRLRDAAVPPAPRVG